MTSWISFCFFFPFRQRSTGASSECLINLFMISLTKYYKKYQYKNWNFITWHFASLFLRWYNRVYQYDIRKWGMNDSHTTIQQFKKKTSQLKLLKGTLQPSTMQKMHILWSALYSLGIKQLNKNICLISYISNNW